MKKIAVTGGSGRAGKVIIKDLLDHGYEVINLDIKAPSEALSPYRECDLTDYGQVFAALHGCDAVVHMGADPRPDFDHFTGAQRFHNNALSTYNVFNAAVALGLQRVVWASSETMLGFPYDEISPRYVPIDEAHMYPQSSYALSKYVGEVLAEQFSRWSGIPFVGLRISNIVYPEIYERVQTFWADDTLRKFNLWGYIDARDVALSVRLGLEADVSGAEVCIIVADDSIMNQPTAELIQKYFPQTEIRDTLAEYGSAFSNEKAREVLGFEPQHSWRKYAQV